MDGRKTDVGKNRVGKGMLLLMVCVMALLLLPNAQAQAKSKANTKGKLGKKAEWSYNEKKKTLTISGTGYINATELKKEDKLGDYSWLGRDEGNLPMFKKIVFKEGITGIDSRFFCLENVKTISLPKSFKKIKYKDPYGINGSYDPWSTTLTKITVNKKNKKYKVSKGALVSRNGKTLYVFPSGKSLKRYQISDKVTKIAERAFYGTDIQKVIIGNRVQTIGDSAFYCSTLKSIVFGNKVKKIGKETFSECALEQLDLPNSLTYIDSFAFESCPLSEITIPSKVNKVKFHAFGNNKKLKKITILGNTEMMEGALGNCTRYMDSNEHYVNTPVTVVLGKKMKASVIGIYEDLGSMISFQVETGNPKYYVKDGNLYKVRGNELVYEKKQEEVKAPADTTTGAGVKL